MPHSLELSGDGLLREHYAGLVKICRTEIESWSKCGRAGSEEMAVPRPCGWKGCGRDNAKNLGSSNSSSSNDNNNKFDESNTATGFDDLRHSPEIMMRIYSYLPLSDRICKLSLVDRAFSRDKIRGGIVCAIYGAGFNLKQALNELQNWMELRGLENFFDSSIKLSRMLKVANLEDGEDLLYTGSNLCNKLVLPPERRRWMTSYTREFFSRERREWEKDKERQQQQQQQQHKGHHSWLTEIVLAKKFLKRYFFDGKVNQLQQLIHDAEFKSIYMQYRANQKCSRNHVGDDGHLMWCLPDLSPGCSLLLLDPDVCSSKTNINDESCWSSESCGGWREHLFVSCGDCGKLHEQRHCTAVHCDHGHHRHVCKNCWVASEDAPVGTYELYGATRVCWHCRFGVSHSGIWYTG